MEFIGRNGTSLLYRREDFGVVVDEQKNLIQKVDKFSNVFDNTPWEESEAPEGPYGELALSATTNLNINVFSSNDRLYTIPKSVTEEAKRALEWRKEHKRGGTPVGLNTARTLAKGGQIGIQKVRHIAKYFPRHEVDKKGKGYKPGEDGYPSKGRIAWALWGGDSAQRWASGIVERENKSASVLASYGFNDYKKIPRVDLSAFEDYEGLQEFFIRVRLDNGFIDRLYKVEPDGTCTVWDDGNWDDLGNIHHDFETYDKSLDDPYDQVKRLHIPIDRESALLLSASFDSNPMSSVPVDRVSPEENEIFQRALPEIDWPFIDQLSDEELDDTDYFDDDGLTAALPTTDRDGNYTPEERSAKAKAQVRDKMGKFAKSGSTVVINGNPNYTGKITSVNSDTQEVNVQLENGKTVAVPANMTQEVSTFEPVSQANFPETNLDFTGILGEPRTPIDQPLAQLPGRLPPLTAPDVNLLVNDWGAWVAGQRTAPDFEGTPPPQFVPRPPQDVNSVLGKYYQGSFNPDGTPKSSWNPATAPNAYNDPLLRNWLEERYGSAPPTSGGYQNKGWYTPQIPKDPALSKEQVYSPGNVRAWDEKYSRYNFLSSITASGEENSPENSDVAPMYMAIVAEDDPQAVMDLVSLVPANKNSTEPTTFKRLKGKWERDDRIMQDLQSPTPPPVVVLDSEQLAEVLAQIDGEIITASAAPVTAAIFSDNPAVRALVAKGGLDRNRGNAETLRRYWNYGEGALKIRWNTPGDWTRCYRQLAKYMGPRAKGYCALRHKEMTGTWPGSKYNIGKKKKKARRGSIVAAIETLKSEDALMNEFALRARAESARAKVVGGRAAAKPVEHGAKFIIPLVIPENVETGDGRIFLKESISYRNLPLPLLWQIKTGQGHDGSVVVGQILSMERLEGGIGNAYGVFDNGEFGKEAERLVRNGFIRGISADMDKFEAEEEPIEMDDSSKEDSKESKDKDQGRIKIKSARVMAVTIVPKPAFQECFIQITEENTEQQEEEVIADGVYVDGINPLDASALVACGVVAGSVPVEPPQEWFLDPKLKAPTPLTVEDDGRVFGHIAAWHVDHIGMAYGTKPPRSRSKYAYFHTGTVKTSEGSNVPVGQLTLAGGHASLEASAQEAVRHYDDTASAVADVHAGEDAFGIWVAGSLRPGIAPEQVRALRASAPSGDWRPIKGNLELVAVCQVNVPGFPIARARVASGQVMALVAAGATALAQMKNDPISEINKKIDELTALQKQPIVSAAESAKSRFNAISATIAAEKAQELSAKFSKKKKEIEEDEDYMIQMFDDDLDKEMSVIPRRVRERLAREKKALPDGSFPIRNVQDLKNAVRAYGRAKPGKRAVVRKHIMRRARGLNRADLIPDKWKNASVDTEFSVEDLRDRIELALEAITADALPGRDEDGRIKYTPQTQPRDASGKFRRVLARLKSELDDVGLDSAVDKAKEAEGLEDRGDEESAAEAAKDLIATLDRLDANALNPEALENVMRSAKELGEVIANLPFDFGQEAKKIRFSDIPEPLRKLIDDMIERVEDKIGKEDADEVTERLRKFKSGSDLFNQEELSSELATLLRLLN